MHIVLAVMSIVFATLICDDAIPPRSLSQTVLLHHFLFAVIGPSSYFHDWRKKSA